MIAFGHPGGLDVTLIDGDVVSPSNCVRQPFSQNEIGIAKCVVLASRINLFWNLSWKAVPENVGRSRGIGPSDLVIGCVDTRAARATIERLVSGDSAVSYLLDLGNGADGGQFVLGQPLNARNRHSVSRLRTASELFPEITDESLDDDNLPSCSAVEALERQHAFLNQVLASHALAMLARLFRYGGLDEHHGAFVSVARQRVQPLAIDPIAWRRLRQRGRMRLQQTV